MKTLTSQTTVFTAFSSDSKYGDGAEVSISVEFIAPKNQQIIFRKKIQQFENVLFRRCDHNHIGFSENSTATKGLWQVLEITRKILKNETSLSTLKFQKIQVASGLDCVELSASNKDSGEHAPNS
jgi:hypothetical protein